MNLLSAVQTMSFAHLHTLPAAKCGVTSRRIWSAAQLHATVAHLHRVIGRPTAPYQLEIIRMNGRSPRLHSEMFHTVISICWPYSIHLQKETDWFHWRTS